MSIEAEDIKDRYPKLLPFSPGKASTALTIWPRESGNVKELSNSLLQTLALSETATHCWIISTWGRVYGYENGAILKMIGERESDFTFCVDSFERNQDGNAMPGFEISFRCSIQTLAWVFSNEDLSLGYGFSFGGWLVPRENSNLFLKNQKWTRGLFLFPEEIELAFNSGEEWECIRFFATRKESLDKMLELSVNSPNAG